MTDQAEAVDGSVRAVERALDILLAFRPADAALTVSDLMARVELSRPTLYRLLRTLEAKRFLISADTPKRFRLGPSVAQLAHVWTSVLDLASLAEPMMRRLRDGTSETVALFVREDAARVCVAELPSAQPLSFKRGTGYRDSLALGASGKAILAHLPEGESAALRAKAKMPARELAHIRKRGFAVSKSELMPGAVAVSAPVFDGTGDVIGSLSVFGPSARLSDARISTFAPLLMREARAISEVLGKSDDRFAPAAVKHRAG